jgi:hypothetical protein
MQFVDPAVSRRKFEREVSAYRAVERHHSARGWWLMWAEFPRLLMAFATPKIKPPAIVFGALLDFTNFDVWPPGVQLVDPFTQQPYPAGQLPVGFLRRIPGGVASDSEQVVSIVQVHSPALPFVCLPGVREYHDHPAHTGDYWFLLRGTPAGRPVALLEHLHKYGAEPIDAVQYQMSMKLAQQQVPT